VDQPEEIVQLVVEGLDADFPPIRSLTAPMRLAAELSSFVGREEELRVATALLDSTRLLTLLGPGGTGKTRLALQIGLHVAPRFNDGIVFVDLGPLVDPRLVESSIARAVGPTEQASRPIAELLVVYLRDRELLLILDNFEHLLPAGDAVAELLSTAPRLKVLVTSRAVLSLPGEQTYLVPPLALPDLGSHPEVSDLSGNEAVALFAERARSANPRFELTPSNAAAVAEIWVRLDGLPLAIELAASRVRVLQPAEILEGLRGAPQSLGEGPRNLPARQRTLRSTIDWSYQLLDPPGRALFTRLAVFEGGCTLKAAEAVCNPDGELGLLTIDGLSALVDHSLVRRLDDAGGSRFRMLETIRDFGRETLASDGALETTSGRHLAYFREIAERAAAEGAFLGPEHGIWLDRFESEQDNLRAALHHAIESDKVEEGLRLAGSVWRLWMQRGYLREGRAWLEALLSSAPADASPGQAIGYTALGGLAYWLSDIDATEAAYEAALRLRRELGDREGEAEALYDRAFVPVLHGDNPEARRRFEAARALAVELGRGDLEAQCNNSLGILLAQIGEADIGLPLLERSVAYLRASGDVFQLTWALAQTAQAEWLLGRFAESRAHSLESLKSNAEAGSLPGLGANLDSIAALESRRGNHLHAMRLVGASRGLTSRTGGHAPPLFTRVDEVEADARTALGDESVEGAIAAGARLSVEEVLAYVAGLPM
jgi:predicted ATPase